MKKCKVAHHELVMPFKVDLDPAHGPNRAQNRCRDVRPNRIVEIYDYPVMKPCIHAFPSISWALPLGRICGPLSAVKVGCGEVPPRTYGASAANVDTSGPRVTKRQPAGWLFASCRASRRAERAERACTTLSAGPLRLRGTRTLISPSDSRGTRHSPARTPGRPGTSQRRRARIQRRRHYPVQSQVPGQQPRQAANHARSDRRGGRARPPRIEAQVRCSARALARQRNRERCIK